MNLHQIDHAFNHSYIKCMLDSNDPSSCLDYAKCVSDYWSSIWGNQYVPVCVRPFHGTGCHHASFYDDVLASCDHLQYPSEPSPQRNNRLALFLGLCLLVFIVWRNK